MDTTHKSVTGQRIIKKCRDYLKIPSVIGFEEPFFQALELEYKEMGLKTESLYNRYGRRILMAVSNNDFRPDKLISAHIDRHGLYKILDRNLIYRGPANEQQRDIEYAAHAIKRINFDKEEINPSQMARVSNYFVGEKVVAYDPVSFETLGEAYIAEKNLVVLDDYLTFELEGLDNLKSLKHQVIPLAFVAEDSSGGSFISGQIDNTLSVSVITKLFEHNLPFTAILTTDEEIGESWIYLERFFSRHSMAPKNILVLDTSPYPASANREAMQENGSVVLRYTDNYAPFNRSFTHQLKNICDEAAIPFDFKDLTLLRLGNDHLGNTELGKLILKTNHMYSGTTLQVPTSEYHTNKEKASIWSIANMYKLLTLFLEKPA
ncbi:MAG: hypothetical protein OEY56_10710 [Cyclobacteriaceae bacterium]|nr:hypothetical protein [Cyclobacteriaceae bacterium]